MSPTTATRRGDRVAVKTAGEIVIGDLRRRTAKAVRTLLGAAGVKLHKRFTLEILED